MNGEDSGLGIAPAVSLDRAVQLARRDFLIRVGWVALVIGLPVLPIWLDRHDTISKGTAAALWLSTVVIVGGLALRWHTSARRRLAALPVVDALGRDAGHADRVARAELARQWGPAKFGFGAGYVAGAILSLATPGPEPPIWAGVVSLAVGIATWQRARTVRDRAAQDGVAAIWS